MAENESDFMDELESVTRLKPVTSSNILLFVIAGLVMFFLIWANFSKVEELTRGQGQVVPSSETQFLQSLEGGILQELLVSEGDLVDKGQVLMRISDVAFSSEERGVEVQSVSLKAKRIRLLAETNGKPFSMPAEISDAAPEIAKNELSLYQSRKKERENSLSILDNKISKVQSNIAETNAEKSRLSDNAKSLREELEITKRLVKQQAVPKLDEIRLERELRDVSGRLEEAQKRGYGLNAELRAVRKEREDVDDKFRSQALGELNDVETRIAQISHSLTSIEDRVYRTELRSPVKGIVNKVAIKTVGGVIQSAQQLVEIVPVDDELKIVARILPSDIAFLTPGQAVNVKITAYDPTRYGSLHGRLVRIGANSVTDRQGNVFFEVEVHTKKNYLGADTNPLPITPGMIASVEVVTGKRTIMEYLLKPILRARSVALTER